MHASLPVSEDTVVFVSALLHAERRRLATGSGTRSLGCYRQAILVLRWSLDGTRIIQLATDNQASRGEAGRARSWRSIGYAYLHEGLTVIAGQAPELSSVLLAAKMAGYAPVNINRTLIEIDRCRTAGPPPGVDLCWSGKRIAMAAMSRSSPPGRLTALGLTRTPRPRTRHPCPTSARHSWCL